MARWLCKQQGVCKQAELQALIPYAALCSLIRCKTRSNYAWIHMFILTLALGARFLATAALSLSEGPAASLKMSPDP